MSKFHSTITRRNFMKGLGLGAAGLGAAATVFPVFHDLDEVAASPNGVAEKHPWWVKDVEEPTCEIDWVTMQRFDGSRTMFNPPAFADAVGPEENDRLYKLGGLFGEGAYAARVSKNEPGYTLKDLALNQGGRFFMFPSKTTALHRPFIGPHMAISAEDLGVPKWQGTPEENNRMVRSVSRLYGAATMGIVELDERGRKLCYSRDAGVGPGSPSKAVDFEDIDEPIETEDRRIIPNKCRSVIVFTVLMSQPSIKTAPYPISQAAVGMGYSEGAAIACRLQDFLRTLGYHCIAESNILGSLANSGGFGVLSGLSELSRLNRTITPDYGDMVRVFKIFTDLPLAPAKPISAGIFRFCRDCRICCDTCPTGTLSKAKEPSWDIRGFWNNPGVKAYYEEAPLCLTYWRENAGSCAICFAVCPFGSLGTAPIHKLIAGTLATTPAFNGFFYQMDKVFGYDQTKDPSDWWDLNLTPYGWNYS